MIKDSLAVDFFWVYTDVSHPPAQSTLQSVVINILNPAVVYVPCYLPRHKTNGSTCTTVTLKIYIELSLFDNSGLVVLWFNSQGLCIIVISSGATYSQAVHLLCLSLYILFLCQWIHPPMFKLLYKSRIEKRSCTVLRILCKTLEWYTVRVYLVIFT
jgi:hypothetical protein